jgi:hypothetical protein
MSDNPVQIFRTELSRAAQTPWKLAEGTYNTWGPPVFVAADLERLRAESETEKVLVRKDGLEFVWAWTQWDRPTRTYWGVKPSGFVYLVRDGAEEVFRGTTLRAMESWWRARVGLPPIPPRKPPKTRDVSFFTDQRSRAPYDADNSHPHPEVYGGLYLHALTSGEYYAGRRACERRAAKRLAAGEHVSWVYEEFVPWVKAIAARYRVVPGQAIDCRWVAYNFALQLEAEWRIRPQDYQEAA